MTPFFDLVLVWNRGVSFGMFSGAGEHGPWLLIALAAAIARVPDRLALPRDAGR